MERKNGIKCFNQIALIPPLKVAQALKIFGGIISCIYIYILFSPHLSNLQLSYIALLERRQMADGRVEGFFFICFWH